MATGNDKKYTEELADKICETVATTSKGLESICKELGVSRISFYKWLDKYPDLVNKYARAKELQAEHLVNEIIDIADDTSNDIISGQFGEMGNKVAVERARLKIDSRKWLAGKLKPKTYGDKLDMDITNRVIEVIIPEE